MLNNTVAFVVVYMIIGAIISGRLLPDRVFSGPKAAEKFVIEWILMWPLWLCFSLSFWIAQQFFKEEDDD